MTDKPKATFTYEEFTGTDKTLQTLNERLHRSVMSDSMRSLKDSGDIRESISKYLIQCKKDGILDYTDKEWLDICIDDEHPNTNSKEVVIFEGKRYRRRFKPAYTSRSGKSVYRWSKSWELLDTD
tara:strand:+ start:84 stop:458 length:375 start_codon:yes stop_codon:yes gene_type:complete